MKIKVECFRRVSNNGTWCIEIVDRNRVMAKATWDGRRWHASTLATPLEGDSLAGVVASVVGLQNMFTSNMFEHPWGAP